MKQNVLDRMALMLNDLAGSYKETRQQSIVTASAMYEIPEDLLNAVCGGMEK